MNERDEVRLEDLPNFGNESQITASSYRFQSFKDATDAYQREFITHKLTENDGNITKTAEAMNIDRSHLYRLMKSFNIKNGDL